MQVNLTRRPDYKVTPGSLGDVHLALHLIIVIVISFQLEIVGVTIMVIMSAIQVMYVQTHGNPHTHAFHSCCWCI